MKPTIAYVDGFNLFYGLLKGTKDLWLDPVEFVRRLIREDHDIQKVKYFSAPRSDLKQYASYYKDIPRDLPSQCQLPDEIPIGSHGNVIHRPKAWK